MPGAFNGEPLHLLLVEDNDAHAEMVLRSFQNHRVSNRITHVKDGQQALDYLFQKGEYSNAEQDLPDVVLLDLRLPKVDGLEVLKRVKNDEKLNRMPIVILTTSAAEKDVAAAYDYRANSYVVKPMDFEKFEKLMDDLGYYWMAWNRDPWQV